MAIKKSRLQGWRKLDFAADIKSADSATIYVIISQLYFKETVGVNNKFQ